jgi:hypothetical protein
MGFILTVTNFSGVAIDEIRAGIRGIVLRNLCSGGSVTLRFNMPWWGEGAGNMLHIPVKAIARTSGRDYAWDYGGVYLNRWNQNWEAFPTGDWTIR